MGQLLRVGIILFAGVILGAPSVAVPPRADGPVEARDEVVREVVRLLDAVANAKHRALLSLTYSSGLRVGEVSKLLREHVRANMVQWPALERGAAVGQPDSWEPPK